MSYLTQMLALTVQNFLSAATGIAVAGRADPRLRGAIERRASATSGSTSCASRFTCCCRCRCVFALCSLSARASIQNFSSSVEATTLETSRYQQPRIEA